MAQKLALVTGAARGIGLATTKLFLRDKWNVAMIDRDAEALFTSPLAALKDPNDLNILKQRNIINNGDKDEANYYRRCRIHAVQQVLFESLDWVGTTDQLSNSTLPLLSSILLNDPEVGYMRESDKVFTQDDRYKNYTGLTRDDLSEEALDRVVHETQWDRELYEKAQAMFKYQYPS